MTHSIPHFFEDILLLNPPSCFKWRDDYTTKLQDIQNSWQQGSQPCCVHGCVCEVPRADFAVSGLPCTDMSRAGKQQSSPSVHDPRKVPLQAANSPLAVGVHSRDMPACNQSANQNDQERERVRERERESASRPRNLTCQWCVRPTQTMIFTNCSQTQKMGVMLLWHEAELTWLADTANSAAARTTPWR